MAKRSAELVRARPDHRRVSNGNQDDAQYYKRQTRQAEGRPAVPLVHFVRNASTSGRILHARFITRIESVPKLAILLARIRNSDCRWRPNHFGNQSPIACTCPKFVLLSDPMSRLRRGFIRRKWFVATFRFGTRPSRLVAFFPIVLLSVLMSSCGGVSTQQSQSGGGNGGGGGQQTSACNVISTGQEASLNGFLPFPVNNAWNQDVSGAAADPNSNAIINFIGPNIGLHPDFGSGLYAGSSMGIPYSVVDASQSPVNVNFTAYGDESDPGPMPIPANAQIEGYPNPGNGDRHVLVIDNSNCFLYELYSASPNNDGSWNAGSAAVWDLENGEQRPWTWTSADAAGLPIFPGLVRYDEVAAGKIQHAIRFTLPQSQAAMVPPASHWAATSSNPIAPPMGMKLRLKANYDITQFSANVQVILIALKKYGMIMADNGSPMYLSGAPDDRWDNNDLHNLSQVPASAFEVVRMTPIYTASNVPQGAAPSITSFTASPTSVHSGMQVTLSWQASGAPYYVISPQIGAVRGNTATVTPTQTTTYTLYATNQYGRTQATVMVMLP
jgi:hypothetical protein